MADGTFAILMLVAGLADMGLNYCGTETGCVGRTETAPRVAISGGQVLERRAETGGEAYLRYDLGHRIGPFGQAVGLSIGDKGEAWVGFGQTYRQSFGSTPFYAELHAMTGLYRAGDGLDLGGPIVFRSGIEAGWENRRGWRFGLGFDHRSNAGIYDENPGVETVHLRVSIPTR
ncbi:Lipid A 3-O-deacylase (PagL) [Marinovum algicola]|jgi:lipid A 3-O-deacylase|nr:Lipid A 3-O-deacylase (PagL) [Marinovum algicola]